MSRTIRQIYEEAVAERNKRLELAEFSNDSKMSVMNGVAWMVAALIYTFESILDVFAVDVSETLDSRINGTPRYYAEALLRYQKGDTLRVREDGLGFGYASEDPTKRIVTQVSYTESTDDRNVDSKLILKVATGERGMLREIEAEELMQITAYVNRIKFAAHASRSSAVRATYSFPALQSTGTARYPRRSSTTLSRLRWPSMS